MLRQEVLLRCANNGSNLLPNRTVIYPANLLSHRQTHLSIQTLAEDTGEKKDPLAPACVQADAHTHVCV